MSTKKRSRAEDDEIGNNFDSAMLENSSMLGNLPDVDAPLSKRRRIEENKENNESGSEEDLFINFQYILNNRIENDITDEEIDTRLETWERMWVVNDNENKSDIDIMQKLERLFPIHTRSGGRNFSNCKELLNTYLAQLDELKQRATRNQMLEQRGEDRESAKRLSMFDLVLNGIIFGFNTRASLLRTKHMANSQNLHAIPNAFAAVQSIVNDDEEEEKLDGCSKYMKFLYTVAWERTYRKKNECLYEPIYHDLNYTYAWKLVGDFDWFIWNAFKPKEINYEMWKCVTSKSQVASQAKKQLTNTSDPMLPELKQKQGSWSFTNGVYFGQIDTFYEYGSEEIKELSRDFATTKFFNMEFDNDAFETILNEAEEEFDEMNERKGDEGETYWGERAPWTKLKTPLIDKILDDQKLSPRMKRWIWVLLGRLLFPVGKHDTWQVMPFFKGIAGSGKSTLLKVIQMLFDPEDVSILTDQVEKMFGLESLSTGKIILGYDIGRNLGLSQMDWQSMVSGEGVVIRRKNRTAISLPNWTIPQVYAGNQPPTWNDNAGSVSRRYMIIEFMHPVRNVNTTLFSDIKKNIPIILKKMILAYLDAVDSYGNIGLWTIVPQEFRDSANRLRKATNALFAFIDSKHVITNKQIGVDNGAILYQSMESFNDAFKQFCNDKRYAYKRLERDYVCDVFARFGISIAENYTPSNGDEVGEYLLGCVLTEG